MSQLESRRRIKSELYPYSTCVTVAGYLRELRTPLSVTEMFHNLVYRPSWTRFRFVRVSVQDLPALVKIQVRCLDLHNCPWSPVSFAVATQIPRLAQGSRSESSSKTQSPRDSQIVQIYLVRASPAEYLSPADGGHYDRLTTALASAAEVGPGRLVTIGDISCDIEVSGPSHRSP